MLNKKVVELLNEQINRELGSAYFYFNIANYYAEKGLSGFANWYMVQVQEEQAHAMLFLKYLQDNGEKVDLRDIKVTTNNFEDFKQPLEITLKHEQGVSRFIDEIYGVALENKEFRTTQFLEWFIKEQVEEEKNAEDLINKYTLFASDGKGLYLLDSELAARVYVAPTMGA